MLLFCVNSLGKLCVVELCCIPRCFLIKHTDSDSVRFTCQFYLLSAIAYHSHFLPLSAGLDSISSSLKSLIINMLLRLVMLRFSRVFLGPKTFPAAMVVLKRYVYLYQFMCRELMNERIKTNILPLLLDFIVIF